MKPAYVFIGNNFRYINKHKIYKKYLIIIVYNMGYYNVFPSEIFLDLELLQHFKLFQAFVCQTGLIFPNIYIFYIKKWNSYLNNKCWIVLNFFKFKLIGKKLFDKKAFMNSYYDNFVFIIKSNNQELIHHAHYFVCIFYNQIKTKKFCWFHKFVFFDRYFESYSLNVSNIFY